jgi:galactokinase
VSALLDGLRADGLSRDGTQRYASLLMTAHAACDVRSLPTTDRVELVVPGRIELVGKHVDYAGGRSLVCPVDRGMVSVAAPHPEPAVVVLDIVRDEQVTTPLAHLRLARALPRPAWRVYVDAVVQRMAMNFGPLSRGVFIALGSSLPADAGLSSSSALTITIALAIAAVNDLESDLRWASLVNEPLRLAAYCSALESGYDFEDLSGGHGVGTLSGTQDQCAILAGAAGHVDLFGYRPERHEARVPWPAEWALLVATSGVVAAKSGAEQSRYNRAVQITSRLVESWNEGGRDASTLRDVIAQGAEFESLAARAETRDFDEVALRARLAQFDQEIRVVVPEVLRGIEAAAPARVARGVAHSVAGAIWGLENQVPETLVLTQLAVSAGAWCASPFGAGFGGSVWALVPTSDAEEIAARWVADYRDTGLPAARKAEVFVTRPSPGARMSLRA